SNLVSLLTPLIDQEALQGFTQLWVASPFHARLTRDRLHVMPDAIFPWSESDAAWICDLLNPLLNEEGMKLIHHQASLFLLCREALDASPLSYAAVSGSTLPNRHPEGVDGGALMRLTAEIQMLLNQHPSDSRRAAGEPDVDGLWLWGGSLIDGASKVDSIPVATRNPLLRSIADAKDAGVLITESDRLTDLMNEGQPLPKRVLLAGGDQALLLSKSLLPKFGKASWLPKREKRECELIKLLQGLIHAA
ncbi:MAG TPA: threonine synthase, partial [Mariprofundaceae bacterium]|nr:threonine synthase [Mariprofundaceae bacterium]